MQTVLKEYGAMQMESEGRVRELERALEDKADKLRVYERMEGELDQLVLDAAAIDDPTLAERILANYGTTAGTSVRTICVLDYNVCTLSLNKIMSKQKVFTK